MFAMSSGKRIVAATFAIASFGVIFGVHQAQAQVTIQQPVQSIFRVNTVVSVPDRGTVFLGGNRRLSMGRTTRGIPGLPANPFTTNRASGYDVGASGAYATVQIISLEEMEADLMRGYIPPPAITSTTVKIEPTTAVRKKADFISRNLGGSIKR